MMRLTSFRVVGFRSVEDSGWIDASTVTSLIGTNESGKSNLLTPLWKLNPAKGGEINAIADYPRARYNEIRELEQKPIFIRAKFLLDESIARELSKATSYPAGAFTEVEVAKDFDGELYVSFPTIQAITSISSIEVITRLAARLESIEKLAGVNEADTAARSLTITSIKEALATLKKSATADVAILTQIQTTLAAIGSTDIESSTIIPALKQLKSEVQSFVDRVTVLHPDEDQDAYDLIKKHLPKFVYYSNYGNLDSEIYLPHVIENMKRTDLGPKEEAKTRTLRVLFDFVNLDAEEIRTLGAEQATVDQKQIQAMSEKKKERDILLQSASTQLTEAFRKWWKQGTYRFRFAADGNFFKIWVSDDKRPDEIELEGRSTGLQWFLSFFLVFLVEAKEAHYGAILLLDEPGLTLHPLAQRDLSAFFDGLASKNQLIFSTHSPFMIDADKLDQVRAVYVDESGKTAVTSDLRASASKQIQSNSIFAAHAALGLTVSDVLLQGCQPVLVEGPSDQLYFSTLKTYFISKGLIAPKKELVFIPTGGTKAIRSVASILSAKEDDLPFVILDSDKNGQQVGDALKSDLYAEQLEKVIMLEDVTGMNQSESEDLLPISLMTEQFVRHAKIFDDEVLEELNESKPCVPQFEMSANKANVSLEKGWKVAIAKAVRRKLLATPTVLDEWKHANACKSLFERLSNTEQSKASTSVIDGLKGSARKAKTSPKANV